MLCVIRKDKEKPSHAADYVYRGMSLCEQHLQKAEDYEQYTHEMLMVKHITEEETHHD